MQIHKLTEDAAAPDLRPLYRMHAELCKALASEHRQALLHAIGDGEKCVGDLAAEVGISVHNVSQHLRVLTIVGFPTATTPGLLDELNRLAFPYRWATRAILLDKTDATKLLTKIRRQWFAKRKSIAAILKEVMTNEASALVDTDASNKAADADHAIRHAALALGPKATTEALIKKALG